MVLVMNVYYAVYSVNDDGSLKMSLRDNGEELWPSVEKAKEARRHIMTLGTANPYLAGSIKQADYRIVEVRELP